MSPALSAGRSRRLATARSPTPRANAREWEGNICDLLDASDVVGTLIAQILSDHPGDGANLTGSEVSQILSVTHQTHRMAKAFRDRYYEAIEAKG